LRNQWGDFSGRARRIRKGKKVTEKLLKLRETYENFGILIPFFEFDALAELIVKLGGLDADCFSFGCLTEAGRMSFLWHIELSTILCKFTSER
jgi:hypothetical protein